MAESLHLNGQTLAGVRLGRGAARLLVDLGYSVLVEFRLGNRRRADLFGLDGKGRVAIVEVKSSRADFRADRKWREYLPYCDRFFFAVPAGFPRHLLPDDTGLIVADDWGAELVRPSPRFDLNGNRRRGLVLQFARVAAERLRETEDGPIYR